MNIANLLLKLNPNLVFTFVTGSGADSSTKGSIMWARVKGKTENDLLKMSFRGAYMFRPGLVIPKNGELSKTKWYRYIYKLSKPLHPAFAKMFPSMVVTTEEIARAMLNAAKFGRGGHVLENQDIRKLAVRQI